MYNDGEPLSFTNKIKHNVSTTDEIPNRIGTPLLAKWNGDEPKTVRMSFGLKKAFSTFQRVMDNALNELISNVSLVIYSTSLQEHLQSIELVFKKTQRGKL